MLVAKVSDKLGIKILYTHCPTVSDGVSSTVFGAVKHHLTDIFAVLILIIGFYVPVKLRICQLAFLFYSLFKSCKAVGNNGNSASVNAHIIVICAAVGDVDALFYKSVLEEVEDKLRLALCLIFQMMHYAVTRCINCNFKMLSVKLK